MRHNHDHHRAKNPPAAESTSETRTSSTDEPKKAVESAPSPTRRVVLTGTTRAAPINSHIVAPADPSQVTEVTVYVRPKVAVAKHPPVEAISQLSPTIRHYLNHEQAAEIYGASQEDVDAIAQFARDHQLEVKRSNLAARSVILSGTVAAMNAAFGVQLQLFEKDEGVKFRGRTGPLSVPETVAPIIEGIFGLDNRPMGRSYLKRSSVAARTPSQPITYFPHQLGPIYNFPPVDGTGQTIGILAFNGVGGQDPSTFLGGYNKEALDRYFSEGLGIKTPLIEDVIIAGPGNRPGDGTSANDVSGEIMLDIQVVGSLVPAAKLSIYFTEFSERGWVDAITTAINDANNKPSVLSISYGNPEDAYGVSLWTAAAIARVDSAFQQAAAMGITVCVASGDDGSHDDVTDHRSHVDFPASSPHVLSCGGTRLVAAHGHIFSETVWNDGAGSATGGGISRVFPRPNYQTSAKLSSAITGRGVPDVAGLAAPSTGLIIMDVSGELSPYPVGGTSATAPLWASLIARINQVLGGPVGFINPLLYSYQQLGVTRDILHGNNGAYKAAPGWDPCTGLGSPDGMKLLNALQKGAAHSAPAYASCG